MVAETQARIQLPATKSPHLFQRYLKTLWEGFLSCSSVVVPPPQSQQVFPYFPTELWSCCSQSSRFLWICCGFFASP